MAERGFPPGWDAHIHVFDANAPVIHGHYAPATRTLPEIEALARQHGIGRLVLVQPSVYGTDNRVLLNALKTEPGRHRGIVVVDESVTEEELDAMQAHGVRGIRFNRVSPVGNDPEALGRLAPRLASRGWHVQWYVHPHHLPALAELQRHTKLPFVLDHLAGLRADSEIASAHWDALAQLAEAGAWVKLSGWYRLGERQPFEAMAPLIRRAAELFGKNLVWGSDWPHTSLDTVSESLYADLLEPVRKALGPAITEEVVHRSPLELYGR